VVGDIDRSWGYERIHGLSVDVEDRTVTRWIDRAEKCDQDQVEQYA